MGLHPFDIKKIPYQDTWDIRHKVMWPNQPPSYVRLPNDSKGDHYALVKNEGIISVVSVFTEYREAQFRKFATLKREQGKGYGSNLLAHVFKVLSAGHVDRIWCNARADKISFYEKFQMKPTQKEFSNGGIDYLIMEKLL